MTADRQRFETIFEQHAGAVRAYCLRRASTADALDATAEVFAVAWRRHGDVPAGRELPWLYGVAARVLSNQRRSALRLSRFVDRFGRMPRPNPPGPEDQLASRETDHDVARALATLSAKDREVITLVAWENLTRQEVAMALRCSPAAINKRYQRALQRLGRALGGDPRRVPLATPSTEVADR